MDIASATGMRLTDARTMLLPAGLSARKTGKDADFDVSLSTVLPELLTRRSTAQAHGVWSIGCAKRIRESGFVHTLRSTNVAPRVPPIDLCVRDAVVMHSLYF